MCFAGCYAKTEPYDEPKTSACEPLAAVEEPVELGTVLGIGEAAGGTVYLMDEVTPDVRVFVSDGGELRRAPVSGGGRIHEGGAVTNLASFEYGESLLTMGVESTESATRAAVGPGGERSFEALLANGEELTILPESVLDDYSLRNLPGDVEVEYVAAVATGERLVVIRPSYDWTYDDFRLFVGEPEPLVERQVLGVTRARDGGSTWIRFDLHGEAADISFPVTAPASLTTKNGTSSVELLPRETITSFSFECLLSREAPSSPPPDAGI
jgi:hypothetical protein